MAVTKNDTKYAIDYFQDLLEDLDNDDRFSNGMTLAPNYSNKRFYFDTESERVTDCPSMGKTFVLMDVGRQTWNKSRSRAKQLEVIRRRIKRVAKHILKNVSEPDPDKWSMAPFLGSRPLAILQGCILPQDDTQGVLLARLVKEAVHDIDVEKACELFSIPFADYQAAVIDYYTEELEDVEEPIYSGDLAKLFKIVDPNPLVEAILNRLHFVVCERWDTYELKDILSGSFIDEALSGVEMSDDNKAFAKIIFDSLMRTPYGDVDDIAKAPEFFSRFGIENVAVSSYSQFDDPVRIYFDAAGWDLGSIEVLIENREVAYIANKDKIILDNDEGISLDSLLRENRCEIHFVPVRPEANEGGRLVQFDPSEIE